MIARRKNMVVAVLVTFCLVLAFFSAITRVDASRALTLSTTITLMPQSSTVAVGHKFQVECWVNNVVALYGVDIQIGGWNTAVMKYVAHTATIPVETYPGGILHSPVIPVKDQVDESDGMGGAAPGTMYWLAVGSMAPAPQFDGSGTAFIMTFLAVAPGSAWINFTSYYLADIGGSPIPGVTSENAHVVVVPQSDFNVKASPSTRIVCNGSSTTYNVTATLLNGATQLVSWSVSGLPPGATYIFTPSSGNPTFNSTLKITMPKTTPAAAYTVTITGTGPYASNTTNVTLKVYSFMLSPTPFSPNGDGAKDNTTINATFWASISWSIKVKNSTGAVVRNLVQGTGSSLTILWDGKNGLDVFVPDGVYKVTLSGSGFSNTLSVTVDKTPPKVTCFWNPNPFNPHIGQNSVLNYTLSEKCSVNIDIYYSNGTLAKTLQKPTTKNAGTSTVPWNGKNDKGATVPTGTYTCRIYATDMAGNKVNKPTGYVTCTVQVT